MRPPSLRDASAASTVQPRVGSRVTPALVIPRGRAIRTLEHTARAYGKEHAPRVGYPAARLAVAAFDELCRLHGLTAHPLGGGRWTSRAPAPGVEKARVRLSGVEIALPSVLPVAPF